MRIGTGSTVEERRRLRWCRAARRASCQGLLWGAAFSWALTGLGGLLVPRAGHAADGEAQLKAALLYNFARFTDWPVEVLSPSAPLTIGLVGDDPGAPALESIDGRSAHGHTIATRRIHPGESCDGCQVVYVCRSEAERWPELTRTLKGKPLLLVSELETFAHTGGVIRLFWVGNRIRFEINISEGRRRSLQLAAQLLSLADVYDERPTDKAAMP